MTFARRRLRRFILVLNRPRLGRDRRYGRHLRNRLRLRLFNRLLRLRFGFFYGRWLLLAPHNTSRKDHRYGRE